MRFLLLLFFLAASVQAQDYPENWATVRLLCQTETSYRLEVEAIGAADTVMLGLDVEDMLVWEVGDEKTRQFEVSRDNLSVSLIVYAWGGVFRAESLVLGDTNPCETNIELEARLREMLLSIEREH